MSQANVRIAIDHSSQKSVSVLCISQGQAQRWSGGAAAVYLLHGQTKASHKLYIWITMIPIIVENKPECVSA